VYVCGAVSEPKDIPETVIQASAAAARASELLAEARGTLIEKQEYPPERDVSDEPPRIGVFVCHCGINIGGVVDVEQVVQSAKDLPNVVHSEHSLYTCSQDNQQKIKAEDKGDDRRAQAEPSSDCLLHTAHTRAAVPGYDS
jgi:heterodisulfide reductase subunit A